MAQLSSTSIYGDLLVTGNVKAIGEIVGSKVYNTGADYAECFNNTTLIYKDILHRIVEITDDERVRLSSKNSKRVIGIVSDNYGHVLNGTEEEIQSSKKIPVGLAGTLYVDTKDVLNKDNLGNFIISNDNGYATVVESRSLLDNIVGKVIGFDFENNRYKVILTLK